MEQNPNRNPSFRSWFFSTQEIVEKTVGLIILVVEFYAILQEIFQTERRGVLTQILNLLFLAFIYFYLKRYFGQRFTVDVDSAELAEILGLSAGRRQKMSELVFHANTFVSQLKNINYFVLATAGLYLLFLSQLAMGRLAIHYGWSIDTELKYGFHLLITLFSYAGAFFLLRCFYVMYLPTIDENGNSILNQKTAIYILAWAALMIFDVAIMRKWYGLFLSEFICGVINSVIFVLLIARFENKILDIPPVILCVLYLYAILQTCLPFVTGDIFGENILKATNGLEQVLPHVNGQEVPAELSAQIHNLLLQKELFAKLEGTFSSIVLMICLVGKIFLAAVLLYVLNTKRIFYYFMTLRRRFEEEDENWVKFFPAIEAFSVEPEQFSVVYCGTADSKYSARVPVLFEGPVGLGATPQQAKENLLKEIRSPEKSQATR